MRKWGGKAGDVEWSRTGVVVLEICLSPMEEEEESQTWTLIKIERGERKVFSNRKIFARKKLFFWGGEGRGGKVKEEGCRKRYKW